MKKTNIFSIAALIICGLVCVNSVKAGDPKKTNEVVVNIKLQQVLSIKVQPSADAVNLEYNSKDDYLNGVSETKTGQLEVFSTGGFEVSVDDVAPFLSATDQIEANTVNVTPALTSGSTTTGVELKTVALGDKAAIIESSQGIKTTYFDITYAAAGEDAYTNKPLETYTANVTYSIMAK